MRSSFKLISILAAVLASSCGYLEFNKPTPTRYAVDVDVEQPGVGTSYGKELMPNSPGERWVYFGTDKSYLEEVTPDVMPVNMVEATVRRRSLGDATTDSYLKVNSRGVWDHGDQSYLHACPIPRLVFPVRVGKKWSLTNSDTGIEAKAEVLDVEEVGTAMGLFEAVKVQYTVTNSNDENFYLAEVFWYAPGVGIVRMQRGEDTCLLRYFEVFGFEAERAAARIK